MKPFSHLIRRTHLYLALFCLPWFVMYGITSLAFSHAGWFDTGSDLYDTAGDAWTEEGSWPCTLAIPEDGDVPREVAAELLATAGLHVDAYGAYRAGPQQINVFIVAFWQTRRLSYRLEEQRLYLYRRTSIPQQILTGMHARAGYQHDGILNDAWAVMVDLTSIGFLLWVATGLYIWWQLPGMRRAGAVGLLAGLLTFVGFLLLL
jgi:hypothetical protein